MGGGMFLQYLKNYRFQIILLAMFYGINTMIFWLLGLPLDAVGYALSLCLFLGAVFLFFDYKRFCVRYRKLEQLKRELAFTSGNFWPPENLWEEKYQEMLQEVCADRQRMADQMEERYREMVDYYTVWAHQIKTPIAAMRLLLQDGDFPESAELREELNRIEQYVEMVLCYLRLDADGTDYVFREYDLDEIVRQVVRRHAPAFIRRKLSLNYEPLSARVVTDKKWLRFVIDQVLTNALKYTKKGAISITLEEPKTLCIADEGIGIAPEDLPRVFERGYTGINGRMQNNRASGLGLYLCRRICENLGHPISITSKPGVGTQVRIGLQNAGIVVE